METLTKNNGAIIALNQDKTIIELATHGKLLRKARLRIWDIMFSNTVTTQLPNCREELEQSAQSLTNAIAIIDSLTKSQSKGDNK